MKTIPIQTRMQTQMTSSLSPSEARVLERLAAQNGPVPEERLEEDAVAALPVLVERGLVMRLGGFARVTPEGRSAALKSRGAGPSSPPAPRPGIAPSPAPRAAAPPPAPPSTVATRPAESASAPRDAAAPEPETAPVKLNSLQEDLLRKLVSEAEELALDDVDGRVVRALEGRGLVRKVEGRLEATDEGRAFFDRHVRRRRRVRSAWAKEPAPGSPGARAGGQDEADERTARARLLRNSVESLRRVIGDAEEIEVGDLTARASDAFDALLELADRIERGEDPRRIPPPSERR